MGFIPNLSSIATAFCRLLFSKRVHKFLVNRTPVLSRRIRKRRYLGRYFAHPMMQNRRAKRDDYKPSAVRVTQRYVP
ncbi:hypothetical protein [Piscirickettsia salmonis]|uniref:hypothetical protein n=1 Tax=Piscirickettsia salmonis TaxID=1238 RepID=UPI00065F4065|nr:hypothetical protein [Piscirickettsia salmonis]QHS25055.1 hypothetical protein GW538_02805 [Piscirickettsia salmonis]QHS28262.1 hypothetical protein GW537_02800 [Piscirickettsia salmonis]